MLKECNTHKYSTNSVTVPLFNTSTSNNKMSKMDVYH